MTSHKLFEILSTFDRKEMSRFEAFVFSPYHNKHQGVRQLVQYLSKIYPEFNIRNCSRDHIIRKALDKDTEYSQLALLFTYAVRLVEQFLITERHKKKTFLNKIMLLEALRQRKCFKPYRKNLDNNQGKLEAHTEKDSAFFRA